MPICSNLRMSVAQLLDPAPIIGQICAIFALAHVQHARADGRQQPLVQRGAEVVAVQIGVLEGELREGMRAIHNHLDAALASHLADLLHREDLAGAIGDVADVNHLGARRDRLLDAFRQVRPCWAAAPETSSA